MMVFFGSMLGPPCIVNMTLYIYDPAHSPPLPRTSQLGRPTTFGAQMCVALQQQQLYNWGLSTALEGDVVHFLEAAMSFLYMCHYFVLYSPHPNSGFSPNSPTSPHFFFMVGCTYSFLNHSYTMHLFLMLVK